MFCTNCGSPVKDTDNFCTACGSSMNTPARSPLPDQPAAPVEYSQPTQPPFRAPQPVASSGNPAVCPWCGAEISADQLSCPRCGATVKAPSIRSESGWAELPGRKDMAKLQFGNSFCQIEGTYVPVADVNLAASDSIYFTHHVLLWKDPQLNITTMPLASGWKRMFAALPLIMI